MTFITSPRVTFTTADRAHLDALAAMTARTLGRPVTVETCAEDGPEWAALMTTPEEGEGHPDDLVPVLSIQTTQEAGRRLVALAADGREVLAAVDDLADLVPVLAVLDLH